MKYYKKIINSYGIKYAALIFIFCKSDNLSSSIHNHIVEMIHKSDIIEYDHLNPRTSGGYSFQWTNRYKIMHFFERMFDNVTEWAEQKTRCIDDTAQQ